MMIDYKVPCVILTIISPVLLYEAPHFRPPTINRRNFVPEGLAPYHASYNAPYRYEHPSPAPQYNRPVRATPKNDMAARNEMPPARNEMMSSPRNDMSANGKRTQRAPGPAPRYAKFTLDDASAGYLNLPHGFQNPIKPSGFQPGNLFSAYKYGPAAGHLPLNSLANYYGSGSNYGVQYGSGVYGAGASYGVEGYSAHNSNRGPVIYPDSQTEKPIEEPLQEVPITPTPVSELTKAAVLHQHMFTSPSTEKPADVPDVQYEIKYVPVYVDEDGKEVKSEELSNYRLKSELEAAKSFAAVPATKSSVAYKYSAVPATSYKYESQKFIPSGYESSLSSLASSSSLDSHEKDYPKDYPHYAPKYEFGYRVHDSYTGSDFGQSEHRDGEVTKGSYHVLLPDGRHQTVNYWSDESGFHAKVKYDGVAKHYPAPTKAYPTKVYDHSVESNAIHS
ncbi:hypothetical protein M8J75_011458 [Diaphorina citri]|nr:hypothetical protein M8J75_011458 [Diaphorina citri]